VSERIVLDLQADEPATIIRLLIREPEGHVGLWQFACLGTEDVFARLVSGSRDDDVVAAAGRRLFDELAANLGVSTVLTAALQVPANDRRSVYVDLSGADSCQELPWEALCTGDGHFLALERWPVARMLGSTAGAVVPRVLQPPLRIAAILSCLGVDPTPEWEALRQVVESASDDVRLLLLLSDVVLHDELAESPPPWLDVAMIPIDYPDLQARLTGFEPHLLHFFCHGDTAGSPHLEIATADNLQAPANGSRHRLEAAEISDLVRQPTEQPWAVVLNACTSAATVAESGARSLAAALVRDHGLQVAIGMREPVLNTDAARFTGAFYRAVLADIHRHAAAGPIGAELDWAAFTVDARAELCRNRRELFHLAAASYKEWTLPVVMVRRAPFTVQVAAPAVTSPESQMERLLAEFKATMHAALPSGAPAATVEAFSAETAPAGSSR
jgi:hypothetical protein